MVLDSYCKFVVTAGKALGINVGRKWGSVNHFVASFVHEKYVSIWHVRKSELAIATTLSLYTRPWASGDGLVLKYDLIQHKQPFQPCSAQRLWMEP